MYYNFKNLLLKSGRWQTEKNDSLYLALYKALKNAIESQELPDNFKLPPSRILARDLGLSRSTVMKAYDLLIMENLLHARQGSGYFTQHLKTPVREQRSLLKRKTRAQHPPLSRLGKTFVRHSEFHLEEYDPGLVCFRPGLPPLDLFPMTVWQKLNSDYWKSAAYSDLSYVDSMGMESLRNHISKYLNIYRNIRCTPDQIVITTGSLHSLSIISTAILNIGDSVVLENPTYKKAYTLFKSLQTKVYTADLNDDAFGMDSLDDKAAKLLYVIPSNQYPSGKKMSLKRRDEVLNFAARKNIWIVEDDYDHEFSNWESPVPSIFSLDVNQSVVYLGTFNKLMHPALRLGYMIVPKVLIPTITAISKQTFRFVAPSLQNVMAEFIAQDHLNKHLRKVIDTANQRKQFFIQCFEELFKGEIRLEVNNTGLHIIGLLKESVCDDEFCGYLRKNDLITFPLSSYYVSDIRRNGLVMGYCSVNKTRIRTKLTKMHALYQKYIREHAYPIQ